MNSIVDQARGAFVEAERAATPADKEKWYLEAAKRYLNAAQQTSDPSLVKVLLYYNDLASCRAKYAIELRQQSKSDQGKEADYTSLQSGQSLHDIGLLSDRLLFKAHTYRISNLSKMPQLGKEAEILIADILSMEEMLGNLGVWRSDSDNNAQSQGLDEFSESIRQLDYSIILPARTNTFPSTCPASPPSTPSSSNHSNNINTHTILSPSSSSASSIPTIFQYLPSWVGFSTPTSANTSVNSTTPTHNNYRSEDSMDQLEWSERSMAMPTTARQSSIGSESSFDANGLLATIQTLREQNMHLNQENIRLSKEMQNFKSDFENKFNHLKLMLKEFDRSKAAASSRKKEAGSNVDESIVSKLHSELSVMQDRHEKLEKFVKGVILKHEQTIHEIKKRNAILLKLEMLASQAHKQVPPNASLDKLVQILSQIKAQASSGTTSSPSKDNNMSSRSTEYSYIQVNKEEGSGTANPPSPNRNPPPPSPNNNNNPSNSNLNMSSMRKSMAAPKHPSTATLLEALQRGSSAPGMGNPNAPSKPTGMSR